MLLSDYPGYERGLARMQHREDELRTFAMTRLLETINDVPARQLTPRHIDLLLLISSPFLITPSRRREYRVRLRPEDVGQFLWIVSPDNPLDGSKPPEDFFASLRPDEPEYFRRFYRAIDSYYDRAMLDRPAGAVGGRIVATSLSASVINRICGAYGGFKDEVFETCDPITLAPYPAPRPVPYGGVLDMPIARLYQYWRWISVDRDPATPLFSRFQDAWKKHVITKWRGRAKAAGFGDDVRSYLISIGRLGSRPSPAPIENRQSGSDRKSKIEIS